MKPSKLEAYYVETFGERDTPDRDQPRPPAPRSDRPRRRERGGFGSRLLLRLCVMFAPMALLGLIAMTTDCGARSPSSMIPEVLRTTACLRANLTNQAASLDGTFRALTDKIR